MPSARSAAMAEQLSCVRVKDLGCADPNACWNLGHCAYSRDEARRQVMDKPEPKRAPRIKDPKAIKAKMRTERKCRCGCGRPATDGHHLLPRSLGGDDVRDNIVGLFHDCHMEFEFYVDGREEVGSRIGSRLSDDEIGYVTTKRGLEAGAAFLQRYYGLDRAEIERRIA